MNRHERRRLVATLRAKGAVAGGDPEARARYQVAWSIYRTFFGHAIKRLCGHAGLAPPRFALLPAEVHLAASLGDHELGHRFARNPPAHELIDGLLQVGEAAGVDAPTYMMLRTLVQLFGLEHDDMPLSSLRDLPIASLSDEEDAN